MRRMRFTEGVVFCSGTALVTPSTAKSGAETGGIRGNIEVEASPCSPALVREETTSLSAVDLRFFRGTGESVGDDMLKLVLFVGCFGVGNIRWLRVLGGGLGIIGEGALPFTSREGVVIVIVSPWAPRLDTGGVSFALDILSGMSTIFCLPFAFKDGLVGGALTEKDTDGEDGYLSNPAEDCV